MVILIQDETGVGGATRPSQHIIGPSGDKGLYPKSSVYGTMWLD